MKIVIETVSNGYIIRDEGSEETVVVANADRVLAAWEMLVEVNYRVGGAGDADGERSMSIGLAPSRRWMEFHPEECRHVQSIEHIS